MKLTIATIIGLLALTPYSFASDCTVTKAKYDAVKNGMTYSQVASILGCDGEELSSSEMAGFKTIMYMWDGNSLGGNMNAMFQNGKLVQKAQFGLK